jgi:hypothetical protein
MYGVPVPTLRTYILNLQRTPPPLDLEFWMLAQ